MSGLERPAEDVGTFGVERIASGAEGKAVRLAVLVRWWMVKEQTVRADAIERFFLPALERMAPQLYFLQPGGFARPFGDIEWFATSTGAAGPAPGLRWRLGERRPMAQSLGSGLAGLIAWIRGVWANPRNADAMLDDEAARAAYLAVSVADARRCWGWGATVEAAQAGTAQTPDGQAASSANPLDPERLRQRRAELEGQGYKKPMKQLVQECGLPDTEASARKIRRLITAAEEAARPDVWRGLEKGATVSPFSGSRLSAGSAAGRKRGSAPMRKGGTGG